SSARHRYHPSCLCVILLTLFWHIEPSSVKLGVDDWTSDIRLDLQTLGSTHPHCRFRSSNDYHRKPVFGERVSMLTDQTIFLTTSTLLIFLGLFAIFYSRNLLKTIISFQIVVFGANLALFSSGLGEGSNLMANTLVLFSIVVGGSVEAVGLALIVLVHKQYGTLDPWEIRRLRH